MVVYRLGQQIEVADRQHLSFFRRSHSLGFPIEAVSELLALSDDVEVDRMINSCRLGMVAECKIIETLAPRGKASLQG